MSNLVRSGLPHDVEADGVRYWLRPPTVEEALSLFALLPGELSGDDDDRRQYWRVLEGWLPTDLFRELSDPDARPEDVATDILSLINIGLPKADQEAKSMTFDELNSMRWDLIIIDLAQSYGTWIEDVLRMPWPRFVLLVTRQDAADARYTLRRLLLHMLPHTTKPDELLDDLRERARVEHEEQPPDIDPELQARIDDLEKELNWARLKITYPPKGKTVADMMNEYVRIDMERCELLKKAYRDRGNDPKGDRKYTQ